MRKLTKKLVSLVLLVILSLTCFACGDKNEDGNEQATLYIWSFTSGFGKEWLDSLIADYESANSNVEIPGFAKKGIKITANVTNNTFFILSSPILKYTR